jgi:hypothetical protein
VFHSGAAVVLVIIALLIYFGPAAGRKKDYRTSPERARSATSSTAASFLSPRDDLHRSYPRAERPQNNISPVLLLLPVGS